MAVFLVDYSGFGAPTVMTEIVFNGTMEPK